MLLLQGEPGALFYIIKEGEAVVYTETATAGGAAGGAAAGGTPGGRRRINQLFKADFFGEQALLADEPRWVVVLVLGRRGKVRYRAL